MLFLNILKSILNIWTFEHTSEVDIYRADELEREATCAKIAQVQTEGKRQVTRTIPYFNLDMLLLF